MMRSHNSFSGYCSQLVLKLQQQGSINLSLSSKVDRVSTNQFRGAGRLALKSIAVLLNAAML